MRLKHEVFTLGSPSCPAIVTIPGNHNHHFLLWVSNTFCLQLTDNPNLWEKMWAQLGRSSSQLVEANNFEFCNKHFRTSSTAASRDLVQSAHQVILWLFCEYLMNYRVSACFSHPNWPDWCRIWSNPNLNISKFQSFGSKSLCENLTQAVLVLKLSQRFPRFADPGSNPPWWPNSLDKHGASVPASERRWRMAMFHGEKWDKKEIQRSQVKFNMSFSTSEVRREIMTEWSICIYLFHWRAVPRCGLIGLSPAEMVILSRKDVWSFQKSFAVGKILPMHCEPLKPSPPKPPQTSATCGIPS